ncbi:uncharacterized protein BP5553_03774 [Venustampulla echinocandica]|uniref:Rho-GAP domain-containing protein n=1 Tax=Venustampulla echinocandica TaxID=2656787 RepID=A0A370TV71_9HELO|nr:uncharacterized protein BP5553_03774 [Venustampulla echinocandica]RDL39434.1 hypothetical protein BP5553_03774 [Venustampulla echinocandica]
MPFFNHGLISRSSSGTISNPHPLDALGGISDNINIAQGLLMRSHISQRQASSTSPPIGDQTLEPLKMQGRRTESDEASKPRRVMRSSTTWTCSSQDILSDREEFEDRSAFVQEYNRLAAKHGVRVIVADDYEDSDRSTTINGKPGSWFLRKILKRIPATQSAKPEKHLKHRRSISDISLRLKLRKDKLKNKSLPELVRLCGLSPLYLPAEYATGNLAIPTCFRATAQYLIQHAPVTSGVFRVPGSHHVVEALYDHYCPVDENPEVISGTVRCPTLPGHIRCDVHDVASTFKKLLSGLPGGILGSLLLFDAFVSIQSQLQWDTELTGTKQRKALARLIALAISTLRSQYRRELICAVFGLLCMVGRTAEISSRDGGSPLPTSDLMGYAALGIVFGPLLVGELLDDWNIHLAKSRAGLVLLPISPPKSKKQRLKQVQSTEQGVSFNTQVDKIKIANGITEMLITHWSDVTRHMKTLTSLKVIGGPQVFESHDSDLPFPRTSISETFALRKPPSWDGVKLPLRNIERSGSPTPTRWIGDFSKDNPRGISESQQNDDLMVKKQRSRTRSNSSHILAKSKSISALSPTVEELIDPDLLKTPRSTFKIGKRINVPKRSHEDGNNKPPCSSSPPFDAPVHTPGPLGGPDTNYKQEGSPTTPPEEECVVSNMSNIDVAPIKMEYHIEASDENGSHSHMTLENQTTPRTFGEILRSEYPHCQDSDATSSRGKLPQSPQNDDNKELVVSTSPGKRKSTTIRATTGSRHDDPSGQSSEIPGKRIKLRKQHPSDKKKSFQEENFTTDVVDLSPIKQVATSQQIPPFGLKGETWPFYTSEQPGIEISNPAVQREPTHLPELQVTLPRRLSDPMFPDLTPEYIWGSFKSPTKDHLSAISHNEDLASLAVLAQFMPNEPLNKADNNVEAGETHDQETKIHSSLRHAQENGADGGPASNTSTQANSATASCLPELNAFTIQGKDPPLLPMNKYSPVKVVHENYNQKLNSILSTTKTPSTSHDDRKDLVGRGSSQGSVKALAAKFDRPPSTSKGRAGAESLSIDSSSGFESPRRLGLVAPYHASPTSPTKSEKSGTLDLTPRPNRNILLAEHNWKAGVHRGSRQESPWTPQRTSIQQPLGKSKPPQRHRKLSREINNFPAAFAVGSVSPYSVSSEHLELCTGSMAKHQGSAHVDRPSGGGNVERKVMSATQPPQVIERMKFHRPPSNAPNKAPANFMQHPRHFIDASNKTQYRNQESSPRSPRSNSLLHSQIRALHLHIGKMEADMRRLKQDLDTKSTLDIRTLSTQLREAKWEIQIWKSRAETAEKQVEIFSKVSVRSKSNFSRGMRTPRLSHDNENVCGPNMDYQSENPAMADITNRGLLGVEGIQHPLRPFGWDPVYATLTATRIIEARTCDNKSAAMKDLGELPPLPSPSFLLLLLFAVTNCIILISWAIQLAREEEEMINRLKEEKEELINSLKEQTEWWGLAVRALESARAVLEEKELNAQLKTEMMDEPPASEEHMTVTGGV